MRIKTWMSVALSAACSCGAESAGEPGQPGGADGTSGETACFIIDGAFYRGAIDICAEQSPGTVAAACVGEAPAADQCEPFRVLYRRQGEERYFCCCNPSLSAACDFALP